MTDKSKISRRAFVAGSGAAVAGTAIVDVSAFASCSTAVELEYVALQKQIGSSFRLRGDLGAVKMKLVSVQPMGAKMATPHGVRDQAFIARFKLPGNLLPMAEKTYSVNHTTLGRFDLYLAPCGQGNCPSEMVAIFS